MLVDPLMDLDAPLLLALSSLLETASVTASARALGRTQSSMSRTLSRLRDVFGDPLLVPIGRGMRLTPRAEQLRVPVARALDSMRRLFGPVRVSSPRDEQRSVRVAAADYTSVVLLNAWIAELRRAAPGVVVRLTPVDASSIEPLARGELDLVVATSRELIVVEVKTRRTESFGHPFEAITEQKKARLWRLSMAWIAAHPDQAQGRRLRIDAIGLIGADPETASLEHLAGIV